MRQNRKAPVVERRVVASSSPPQWASKNPKGEHVALSKVYGTWQLGDGVTADIDENGSVRITKATLSGVHFIWLKPEVYRTLVDLVDGFHSEMGLLTGSIRAKGATSK